MTYTPTSDGSCDTSSSVSQSPTHTYTANGSYTVTLQSGTSLQFQSTATVVVGASGTGTVGATLIATPTSGASPLSVSFSTGRIISGGSYSIDFGDGSTQPLSAGNCINATSDSSCTYGTTHTYASAGTYSVKLIDGNGTAVASLDISVTEGSGSGTQALTNLISPAGSSQTSGTQGSGTGISFSAVDIGSNSGASSSDFTGALSQVTGYGPAQGNIFMNGNGATFFGQESGNNSAVAGFYGSDTLGGQSQGLVASLCQSRPWASSVLSYVIPPSFFDGLCSWRGYQVGQTTSTPQVTLQQQPRPKPQPAATSSAPTQPSVAAQAQIWAVPSAVPLGSRTSIFWNTQGVASCTETSPDGNFTQNSLSGGASTVPLTGATTFTISCLDPSGNPITDFVTVQISD